MRIAPPETVLLTPPVYFLSDAHLGAAPAETTRIQIEWLTQLLHELAVCRGSLVIAGDLFDFWYEWKHVIPKQHFGVLLQLRALVDQKIAVHYLAGNHDFRLHGFLESQVGLKTHRDALIVTVNDRRVYVFHGDGVLKSDYGYRLLKRVLRNPVSQRAFSWIHPDLGMVLARGTSKTSRAYDHGGPEDNHDYLSFARERFAEGFTGVVMGHTHRPIEHCENSHTYLNLGDWITHFTYGVHDGSRLMLRRWSDASPSHTRTGE